MPAGWAAFADDLSGFAGVGDTPAAVATTPARLGPQLLSGWAAYADPNAGNAAGPGAARGDQHNLNETVQNQIAVSWNLDDGDDVIGWLGSAMGTYGIASQAKNFEQYSQGVQNWGQGALDRYLDENLGTKSGSTRSIGYNLGGFNVKIGGGIEGQRAPYSGSQLATLQSPGIYGTPTAPTIDVGPALRTLQSMGYTMPKGTTNQEQWVYDTIHENNITPEAFYRASVAQLQKEVKKTSGTGLAGFLNQLPKPEVAIPLVVGFGLSMAGGAAGSFQGPTGISSTAGPAAGSFAGAGSAGFTGVAPAVGGTVAGVAGNSLMPYTPGGTPVGTNIGTTAVGAQTGGATQFFTTPAAGGAAGIDTGLINRVIRAVSQNLPADQPEPLQPTAPLPQAPAPGFGDISGINIGVRPSGRVLTDMQGRPIYPPGSVINRNMIGG